MKNIINKYSKYLGLALIAFALSPVTVAAQNKKDKKAEIKNIVEAQSYVFKAQTALPTIGRYKTINFRF